MRKIIAILLILLCAGGLESCRDSKLTSSKSSIDTIVSVQENGDSLFFVINEKNETIDWWGYSLGVKVSRQQYDSIRKIADTLQNLQTNKDSGTNNKGLNEIRFAHFEDKDWLDNDYIRCLRKYLDDYLSGKIEDDGLEPYKEIIKGKFVLGDTEPFLLGGLFIRFIFLDSPNNMFSAWVYSDVDEDREVVTGYSVRAIKLEDDNSGFTKNRILELVKEHPELKLW